LSPEQHADLPTRPILAYFSDFWPKFHPQYDLRPNKIFFTKNIFFLIDENDPLNLFIHSKMQNDVSFCLIIAHVGEKNIEKKLVAFYEFSKILRKNLRSL
jgi:hypothetical protein